MTESDNNSMSGDELREADREYFEAGSRIPPADMKIINQSGERAAKEAIDIQNDYEIEVGNLYATLPSELQAELRALNINNAEPMIVKLNEILNRGVVLEPNVQQALLEIRQLLNDYLHQGIP